MKKPKIVKITVGFETKVYDFELLEIPINDRFIYVGYELIGSSGVTGVVAFRDSYTYRLTHNCGNDICKMMKFASVMQVENLNTINFRLIANLRLISKHNSFKFLPIISVLENKKELTMLLSLLDVIKNPLI